VVRRAEHLTIAVPLLLVIMFVLAAAWSAGWAWRSSVRLPALRRRAGDRAADHPRSASFFLESSAFCCSARSTASTTPRDFIRCPADPDRSVTIDSVQILVLVLGVVLMAGLQLWSPDRSPADGGGRAGGGQIRDQREFRITATFFLGGLAGVAGSWAGAVHQ